jgi:hypothetical protein
MHNLRRTAEVAVTNDTVLIDNPRNPLHFGFRKGDIAGGAVLMRTRCGAGKVLVNENNCTG